VEVHPEFIGAGMAWRHKALKLYRPTKFLEFIDFATGKDSDSRILVLQMIGAMLSDIPVKKIFFLKGPSDSGKSILCGLLQKIFGEFTSNIPLEELVGRFNKAGTDGMKVNISSETSKKSKTLDATVSFIKRISGNDTVYGERKFGAPYSFKARAKQLYACNDLPHSSNMDAAYYNRISLIAFDNPVTPREINPDLLDELEQEKAGIVYHSLSALRSMYKFSNMNFKTPEKSEYYLELNRQLYASKESKTLESVVREFMEREVDIMDSDDPSYNAYAVEGILLHSKLVELTGQDVTVAQLYRVLEESYHRRPGKIRTANSRTCWQMKNKSSFTGSYGLRLRNYSPS